jgi:hypothetical protein
MSLEDDLMRANRILEHFGVFDFRAARKRVETLFSEAPQEVPPSRAVIVEELVLLSAAELTLLPIVLEKGTPRLLPLLEPLRVSNLAADAAFVKTACLPRLCLDPTVIDITLFTGDSNKLEVARAREDLDSYWDEFNGRIRSLDTTYQEAGETFAELSSRGFVILQGLLWKAKLGTISRRGDLANGLKIYHDDFGLTEKEAIEPQPAVSAS